MNTIRLSILISIAFALRPLPCLGNGPGRAEHEIDPYHIVLIADAHIPGRNLAEKEKIVETINSWGDVDLVAVLGDIVATGGNKEEYSAARAFFDQLKKPTAYIGGNHDYIYPDDYPVNPETGHHLKNPSGEERKLKLERFKETWGIPEIFYSIRTRDYLLIFLTPDDLVSNNDCQVTDRQLDWLMAELKQNKDLPTLIFFHAPLKGTYFEREGGTRPRNPESDDAEPAGKIRQILLDNPQVFLWGAGHLHMPATREDFASPINLYENQVTVVHTSTLNVREGESRWSNSLFLYPYRVVIKTYDHTQGVWVDDLERELVAPVLKKEPAAESAGG